MNTYKQVAMMLIFVPQCVHFSTHYDVDGVTSLAKDGKVGWMWGWRQSVARSHTVTAEMVQVCRQVGGIKGKKVKTVM